MRSTHSPPTVGSQRSTETYASEDRGYGRIEAIVIGAKTGKNPQ
jgi:hypothetical protein